MYAKCMHSLIYMKACSFEVQSSRILWFNMLQLLLSNYKLCRSCNYKNTLFERFQKKWAEARLKYNEYTPAISWWSRNHDPECATLRLRWDSALLCFCFICFFLFLFLFFSFCLIIFNFFVDFLWNFLTLLYMILLFHMCFFNINQYKQWNNLFLSVIFFKAGDNT